ncbi:MAG: hypothetical protein HQL75_07255 [Magnetococcales bacterium]|nr:hypothetical protein [Magnetococcales bacterium]
MEWHIVCDLDDTIPPIIVSRNYTNLTPGFPTCQSVMKMPELAKWMPVDRRPLDFDLSVVSYVFSGILFLWAVGVGVGLVVSAVRRF